MSVAAEDDAGMTHLIPVNEFTRSAELSPILDRWKPPIT
ncbi:hypothetical protein JOF29_005667 [Kribbella aluminosa]|uniref:Uncharacterized protein n=1 Tax=Kribbella aluminosa TaxID=416017 RepID=A0ABS4USE9_9ACTN|nr:hypothetical protein [Kribbella aluminosa]